MSTEKGRETLTRDRIVDAAIRILDADGLDALSMRRLATDLDAGAASLYWHVRTKDELLDLVTDRVVGEVAAAIGPQEGWRSMAAAIARSLRSTLLAHPGAAAAIGRRPPEGPNTKATLERLLETLRSDGFTTEDAALVAETVITWASASVITGSRSDTTSDRAFEFGLEALLHGIESSRGSAVRHPPS
jgi:AcrR family transcriptional regulator